MRDDKEPAGADVLDRPFDPAEMLDWLGGNKPLAREVTALFLEECPRLLSAIKVAIAGGDALQRQVAAHTLRGAAGNVTAHALAEAARGLEALGREASDAAVAVHWQRLEREAHRVLEVLRGVIANDRSPAGAE